MTWNVDRVPEHSKGIIRIEQAVKIAGQPVGDYDVCLCRQLVLAISDCDALHRSGAGGYNYAAESGDRWSGSTANGHSCLAGSSARHQRDAGPSVDGEGERAD